ncbi:MAG: NAD(+)/NADH kinase [Solirubrobacteraceae bacterium]|nr:NAD(+)/NADH kinase [Patulibacter sp.]
MTTSGQRVVLMSHGGVHGIESPVRALLAACTERGVELCIDASELEQERLVPLGISVIDGVADDPRVSLCITLGGDGTILRALRTFHGTKVPVFAVNFGQVGFLATVEPLDLPVTFAAALDGAFDRVPVPSVTVSVEGSDRTGLFGINDVSVHRRQGARVAEIGYGVGDAVIGAVRCDGLVACTPAGSTGYNLANGGPILAWGVEGYGVSFIAPHSLTARSIVVSPNDALVVENRGKDALELAIDGRGSDVLVEPGRRAILGYHGGAALLAQMPDSSFYARLREKFGHLRG